MSEPRRRVSAVLVLLSIAGACNFLAPRPDPSRFFTLTPMAEPPAAKGALQGRTLGIGPITFPAYLERPELVVRINSNEVRHASFDYWAGGSLLKQLELVLSQNLQTLLSPDAVLTHPWYAGAQPDVAVEIDVRRLERATDGQVHLVARWSIRKGPDGRAVRSGETSLSRAAGEDPAATAAGLSELLADFSREIAAAVPAVGGK